jgi:acetyltransferase-like isoleucine patch superfamily enzyme
MNNGAFLTHDWFPQPLPANIIIGERSWCYSSFAFLHYQSRCACGVHVGHDSGIYKGTLFDLGPDGEVEIGNYATLVGVIISTNSRVVIGDYAFLAHEVLLADSFAATPHSAWANVRREIEISGHSTDISLGNNCWIGARAVLLSGAVIGEGAIVGAGALVDFEVPPFAVVAGNPARMIGWAKY